MRALLRRPARTDPRDPRERAPLLPEIADIYVLAVDYDAHAPVTRELFAVSTESGQAHLHG